MVFPYYCHVGNWTAGWYSTVISSELDVSSRYNVFIQTVGPIYMIFIYAWIVHLRIWKDRQDINIMTHKIYNLNNNIMIANDLSLNNVNFLCIWTHVQTCTINWNLRPIMNKNMLQRREIWWWNNIKYYRINFRNL